jgi:hypothetical protein
MPDIKPQASRTFEFQIMHPTFEDAVLATEDGEVVPGLRHIASYFYEGTKADTIGNMFPVVLAALTNGWSEDGKVFIPWFNDQNIKLTPYAMNIVKEAGGLRSFRKGDAIRLVGSGYEEQGDDVRFYDTEGKKVSTYIFDGERFHTTQRRLVVSHAITLEEPQPEPEEEPEAESDAAPEVDASGEAPAAEATAGASTEKFEHGIEVGMEIEATSSTPGVPPQRGIVVAVTADRVTIKREDGEQVTMNVPPKNERPPVPPPPPPPKPPVPPPPPADEDEEEGEEQSVYLPAQYADHRPWR